MITLLKEFLEIFAWNPNDMPRINTDIISHELKIEHMIQSFTKNKNALRENKWLTILKDRGEAAH